TRKFRMRALRIRQFEFVFNGSAFVVMLEEIIDSFLLHETTDEVEVRLPVLNAMVQSAIGPCQRGREIIKTVILKNLLDDSGNGQGLRRVAHGGVKNATVSGAREKPKPRNDGCLITIKPVGARPLDKGTDVTAEVAFFLPARGLGHAPANCDSFAND